MIIVVYFLFDKSPVYLAQKAIRREQRSRRVRLKNRKTPRDGTATRRRRRFSWCPNAVPTPIAVRRGLRTRGSETRQGGGGGERGEGMTWECFFSKRRRRGDLGERPGLTSRRDVGGNATRTHNDGDDARTPLYNFARRGVRIVIGFDVRPPTWEDLPSLRVIHACRARTFDRTRPAEWRRSYDVDAQTSPVRGGLNLSARGNRGSARDRVPSSNPPPGPLFLPVAIVVRSRDTVVRAAVLVAVPKPRYLGGGGVRRCERTVDGGDSPPGFSF